MVADLVDMSIWWIMFGVVTIVDAVEVADVVDLSVGWCKWMWSKMFDDGRFDRCVDMLFNARWGGNCRCGK